MHQVETRLEMPNLLKQMYFIVPNMFSRCTQTSVVFCTINMGFRSYWTTEFGRLSLAIVDDVVWGTTNVSEILSSLFHLLQVQWS